MRKLLLLSAFVLLFVGAFAQISVESFNPLPDDLTASSPEGKRIDQSGELAALIKIVTIETEFAFEGGTLGIVDTQQRVGEIWVWVPRGSRKITLKHPLWGVLRDYRFPVEIEAGHTYEMVLDFPQPHPKFDNKQNQYLVFQISPKDAKLKVNGVSWNVDGDGESIRYVQFGTYTYQVEAPNYYPESGTITLDNPDESMTVTIQLRPIEK